ncbi:myogenesis-regulating glycosidase-like [Ptychodera flava]|uniref:myogenesis-regulating glycosidase-like n=1 Tax=Ptychodera flava TaxID=63121 RepID=UPI00396A3EB3
MFGINCSKKTQQIFVGLLITLLIIGILAWYYVSQHAHVIVLNLGPLELNGRLRMLSVDDRQGDGKLEIHVGQQLTVTAIPLHCDGVGGRMNLCMEWMEDTVDLPSMKLARLKVDFNTIDTDARCYDVHWQALSHYFVPEDCISFGQDHWYGGAPLYQQRLTLEKSHSCMQPYITGDLWSKRNGYGSVVERIWMSSGGMMISVPDDSVPLHVGINDRNRQNQLCLKADYGNSKFMYSNLDDKGFPELRYTICDTDNIKQIQEYAMDRYYKSPESQPDETMIKFPIWSVKSYFNEVVNQTEVLRVAEEIKDHDFNRSHIVIDEKHSRYYGDFEFDSEKFPDPKAMIDELHEMGYRVTLNASPFIDINSHYIYRGMHREYWIRYGVGDVPGLVLWREGSVGFMLDLTNDRALTWYQKELKNLQFKYGVDAFKFIGGEAAYLPGNYVTHRQKSIKNPLMYSHRLVEMALEFGPETQIGVGHSTQAVPLFIRMGEKSSGWGYNNGIKAIIPTVLQYGLIGYPYVIPAPIGGNPYLNEMNLATETAGLPDRELYIRWLELVAYLPVMEFTTLPWKYDAEVVEIAHKMVKIHELRVAPLITSLIRDSVQIGAPIIRPLWWIAPEDPQALLEDTEFLIGNNFLVAPVLERGQLKRDIYLPKLKEGRWKDSLYGKVYNGGQWYKDFPVALDAVATFSRVTGKENKLVEYVR